MSAGEVAGAVDGLLEDVAAGTDVVGPVVIDSRRCTPGSLFVAVRGDHTDGHDHVGDARRRGAVLALTTRAVGGPAVVVEDTVAALGRLATAVLRRTGCRVAGVTGSSGKTSTKDLMAAVLRSHGPTVAAAGSYNNELGLPLTVLQVADDTRHLVLEYSARGTGHIAYLCRVARPDVAVVLNVGSAHLGEFGSREAVAQAKGELVESLPPDGTAVLCLDDPLVAAMAERTSARVIGYGESAEAQVRVESLALDPMARPRFRLVTPAGTAELALRLHGAHQAGNAAAAAAVGLAEGVPLETVARALTDAAAASAHRMQVATRSDGLLVVDDAYNANPESMRAALDALARLGERRPGHTWAVLGEMRELGPQAAALHREVGRYAASRIDELVVVGDAAAAIAEGADATARTHRVSDPAAAAALLHDQVGPADAVLVKASNAQALWQVAEALLAAEAVEVGS